jgi:hypothetical protein
MHGVRLGANDDGTKLGANGDGAKVLPRQRQLGVVGQVAWELDANVNAPRCVILAPTWMAPSSGSIF